MVVFVVTGGTEQAILRLWHQRRDTSPGEPLFLIAHPGHNSLPASLEALARLHQLGATGRIIYLQGPQDEQGLARLSESVDDLVVRAALREVRIGMVGPPSDWLVASSPEPRVVREMWGPHVVPVALESVYERFRAAGDAGPLARDITNGAAGIGEPDTGRIREAARLYEALESIVADGGLDAVAVRCFDVLFDLDTSGCVALAQLNDKGVIAGCEGDLVSTVGMIWVQRLLGLLPWMANPARVDGRADTLWLAHCTVPRSLVGSYSLRSHFESGLGVGIEGHFPEGPVTLLRIGGAEMEKLWVGEGRITQTGSDPQLCRTQIQVQLQAGRVSELLEAPLGNHLIVVAGHHSKRLVDWRSMMVPRTFADLPSGEQTGADRIPVNRAGG